MEASYNKIDVLLRNNDVSNQSVNVLSYNNCTLILSGDYIIIEETLIDDSIVAKIYNLKEVVSYRKIK